MADFRIVIQTDTSKANRDMKQVDRNLKRVESTADRVRKTIRNAFAITGVLLLVRKLISLADVYTSIQNRLRIVTSTTGELTRATEDLFKIANKTRSSFKATAELYTRTALVTRSFGVSQKELAQFTESVNKAVIISGAAYIEAHQGIIQLSQGIASGILRGDELRSVLEQLPAVAEVIAKEMKVTRGELRELGAQGKITADLILRAFRNAREELNEKFAKTIPTVGQAMTILETNFIQLVSKVNQATGATDNMAAATIFLANNMQVLAVALFAAAAGLAAYFAGLKLSVFLEFVKSQLAFSKAVKAGTLVVLGSLEAERQRAVAVAESARQDLIAANAALVRARAEAAKAVVVRGSATNELARLAVLKQVNILEANHAATVAVSTVAVAKAGAATKATATVSGRLAAKFPLMTRGLNSVRGAFGKLGGAMKAHPLLAAAAVVVAITVALTAMSDEIGVAEKGYVKLSDVGNATLDELQAALVPLTSSFSEAFDIIGAAAEEMFGEIDVSLAGFVRFTARALDKWIGIFVGAYNVIVVLYEQLPAAMSEIFIDAFNGAIGIVETSVNTMLVAVNAVRKKVGLDTIADVQLDRVRNVFEGGTKELGAAVREAFLSGFNQSIINDTLTSILDRARQLAFERDVTDIFEGPEQEAQVPGRKGKGKGGKDNLEAFLRGLQQEIALLKLSNQQRQIAEALLKAEEAAKRALTKTESALVANRVLEIQALTDRNAVTEYLDDLDKEIFLLQTDASQREIRAQLLELETSLIGGLTEETTKLAEARLRELDATRDIADIDESLRALRQENAALAVQAKHRASVANVLKLEEQIQRKLTATERDNVVALSVQNKELEAQNKLLDELGLVSKEVASEQDLITGAWKRGAISLEQYNDQLARLQMESIAAEKSFRGGVLRAMIELDKQTVKTSELMGDTLVSAINKAGDAMVHFAQEGSFQFKKLFRDIFSELLRLSTQRLFTNLFLGVGNLFGGLPGFANGGGFNVGGSGGTDSQLVAFRATPGERVDVSTSGQQAQQTPVAAAPPHIEIVNVTDPAAALRVLDSSDGKQIIMNTIESNPQTVRKLLRLQ